METKKIPYELLIRWGQSGQLQGAQLQHRYIIKDGDKIVGESLSEVEGLSVSGDFPLAEVMTVAQASAIEAVGDASQKLQDLQHQFDAEMQAKDAEMARITAQANSGFAKYEAEIRRLEAELQGLKSAASAAAAPPQALAKNPLPEIQPA